MDSRSLTVAAEDPTSLASFKSAVVVELPGENPLGLAFGRLTRSKVSFATLPLNSSMQAARHSSSSGRP
eukprot:790528-Pleurochrysis_carterae.AAC.1